MPWGRVRRFCWFSRGIVEAEYNDEEFGLEGAKDSLQRASALTAQDLCLAILQSAQNFMDAAPAQNDVTALALLRYRLPPGIALFQGESRSPTAAPAKENKTPSRIQLAGDADLAAVRFDDRSRDGQSHARSLHPVSLILAAIELVKNQRLLHVVNPSALVGDADFEVGAFQLRP